MRIQVHISFFYENSNICTKQNCHAKSVYCLYLCTLTNYNNANMLLEVTFLADLLPTGRALVFEYNKPLKYND